jgi:hypothetical protein
MKKLLVLLACLMMLGCGSIPYVNAYEVTVEVQEGTSGVWSRRCDSNGCISYFEGEGSGEIYLEVIVETDVSNFLLQGTANIDEEGAGVEGCVEFLGFCLIPLEEYTEFKQSEE